MKKTFNDLEEELNSKISPIFAAYSKKLHERVETIVAALRKKLPITKIIMCNSTWYIYNGPMLVRDDGGNSWEAHENFLDEYMIEINNHNNHWVRPEISLTTGDLALIKELVDILNALAQNPDLSVKDWKFS